MKSAKRIIMLLSAVLFLLGTGMRAYAQSPEDLLPEGVTCDSLARFYKAQPFYCDCEFNSHVFTMPIDTVIKDTVWYTASAEDLVNGISAYWFSTTSVTMEVYAMCVSSEPTFTLTVGGNQMREMDLTKINQKLAEMGNAVAYIKNLKPHIRVYPHNGGSGRVYCYPYDQGPLGTCADSIPIRHGMTYVCSHPENVYRLPWSNMPSTGKAFIRWKQEKDKPADFRLTQSACDGEEVGRATLSDSVHVFMLDSALLVNMRAAKEDLWLHVSHGEGYTGRFWYYTNPKYADPAEPVEQTTCEGKSITVNGRSYKADTVFTDTLCVAKDTLMTQAAALSFTPPVLQYDTVTVEPSALARGYVHALTNKVFYAYGDTIVEVVKKETCTKRYQVTILQPESKEAVETAGASGRQPHKVFRNGQMVIILEDKAINVLGQQIKNK